MGGMLWVMLRDPCYGVMREGSGLGALQLYILVRDALALSKIRMVGQWCVCAWSPPGGEYLQSDFRGDQG